MTNTEKLTTITNAVIKIATVVRDNAPAVAAALAEIRTAAADVKAVAAK